MSTNSVNENKNMYVTTIEHPVYDFLTKDVIELLRDIHNKKLKQNIIILHGSGSNGISCFIEILKRLFDCIKMKGSTLAHEGMNYSTECNLWSSSFDETKNVSHFKHDLAIVTLATMYDIEDFTSKASLERFATIGLHAICTASVYSKELQEFKNTEKVKVIEFKNVYCRHISIIKDKKILQKIQQESGGFVKPALPFKDVVNNEAIRIINKIINIID